MTPLRFDTAVYVSPSSDGLINGVSCGYVDVLMRPSDTSFRELSKPTEQKFRLGKNETLPCELIGFRLDVYENGTVYQSAL